MMKDLEEIIQIHLQNMKKKAKTGRITKVDADVLDKLVRLQVFIQNSGGEGSKEISVIVKEVDAKNAGNSNNKETL